MTTDMILRKYAIPRGALDREPVKDALLADLRAQKTFNNKLYIVFFVAICIVYVIVISGVITDLVTNQTTRQTILAAAGLSIPFTLNYMRKTVGEWSKTNLLLTLIGHSDENSIQALIAKLMSSDALGLNPARPESGNP
jgi:hypothetical protein